MTMVKVLVGILGVAALVYLGLCGWLWFSQRRLMFLPSAELTTTPADLGLAYETVVIPVGEGGRIHGWWLPGDGPSSLTVLYLHGNAGNISTNLGRTALLRSLGVSVLTIDYRGYGLSSGPLATEHRLYEDAEAAYRYLHEDRGIDPSQLVIYGHSLGGAIAIELARRVPGLAALIIDASFTSMVDMVVLSRYNRWFPVRHLLTQRFDSLTKVPHLKLPIFYIHGLADIDIPPSMAKQLYEETPEPKSIWLVPEVDHNNLPDVAGAELQEQLRQFFQRYLNLQP
jgi:fermentation-respiration switch protein FrsA (DUF1100 family)